MDLHLERGLRLHAESEYKALYSWAINEIDAQGQPIGHDQIPWDWTLYFTATSCVLGDSIDIKSKLQMEATAPAKYEVAQSQVIRMQLRPGDARRGGDFHRSTTFKMFGTDRAINSFQLDIHPITDPDQPESCTAWGAVSSTYEIDFVNETSEDCIVFSLYVKPETFARYAAKVALGNVDEIIFSAGGVAGFYSGWSPSISTRNVKVLTSDEEHQVELPPDQPPELQSKLPRLGEVGEATLYINRCLEFGKRVPEPPPAEQKAVTVEPLPLVPETRVAAEVDPRILKTFGSLKRAAWFVVVLLGLIFLTTLAHS